MTAQRPLGLRVDRRPLVRLDDAPLRIDSSPSSCLSEDLAGPRASAAEVCLEHGERRREDAFGVACRYRVDHARHALELAEDVGDDHVSRGGALLCLHGAPIAPQAGQISENGRGAERLAALETGRDGLGVARGLLVPLLERIRAYTGRRW